VLVDDYSDIEEYMLRSGYVWISVEQLRPRFPRWRRFLLENGVERVSRYDAKANNLMVSVLRGARPRSQRDEEYEHNLRNVMWSQGVPTFRIRGWKS
jgi:hypothetical protein